MKRLLCFAALLLASLSASATCTLGRLTLTADANGVYNSFIRPPSTCIDAMVLAANVAETYTVQTGARYCIFSSTAAFYARKDATAAVPSTEVADGTASELSPSSWYMTGTTTISFIAPSAATITISCYI